MAAYPFGWNPPSLNQFIETATKEYGARVVTLEVMVNGPFGAVRPRFLERDVDGKTLHVALPHWDDDSILLEPLLIRNLCARLGMPMETFSVRFDDETGVTTFRRD